MFILLGMYDFDLYSKISHTVQLWQLYDIAPHHMGKEMKVPLNEVLHGKLTFFDMAKNLQTICSAVGHQKSCFSYTIYAWKWIQKHSLMAFSWI